MNIFIDNLQVVTTDICNIIADFCTTNHSALNLLSAFTSLYLVTTLNSGNSSAVFSLDVFW
jgi:hypothetical protein